MRIRKSQFVLTILILSFANLYAQSGYQKLYPTINYNYPFVRSICNLNNGSVISFSFQDTLNKIGLIRVNSVGDTLWTKQIYSTNPARYAFVKTLSDNCFMLCFSGFGNLVTMKFNDSGDKIWSREYTANNVSFYMPSVVESNDNGFVYSFGSTDVKMLKTDSIGDVEWVYKFDGINNNIITYQVTESRSHVIKTSDGGFVAVGYTSSAGIDRGNSFIVKTNSAGNLEWAKILGDDQIEIFRRVIETNDNGIIAVGYTDSWGAGNRDFYVVKFDSLGNIIWSKTYGTYEDDQCFDVAELPDNNLFFAGITGGMYSPHGLLIKSDSLGNIIWSNKNTLVTNYYDMFIENNTDIMLGGYAYDSLNATRAVCLFNADSSGNIGCNNIPYSISSSNVTNIISQSFAVDTLNINLVQDEIFIDNLDCEVRLLCQVETNNTSLQETIDGYQLYPNPIKQFGILKFNNEINKQYHLQIYNSVGELINSISNINTDKVIIRKNNLPSGLYLFYLKSEGQIIYSGKFIIE